MRGLVVADEHLRGRAGEDLRALGRLAARDRGVLLAFAERGAHAGGVDVQPGRAARPRERGVRPALGQVAHAGDDGRVLDGPALHPVAGQAVGVLDVLGDVAGRELAHGARVGIDHDPVIEGRADGRAGAVVNVDLAVVAAADDALTDGDDDGPVGPLVAEMAALAVVLARGAVQRRARLLATRDQHRPAETVLGTAWRQSPSAAACASLSVCTATRPSWSAHRR
jgi:hypothetical protein